MRREIKRSITGKRVVYSFGSLYDLASYIEATHPVVSNIVSDQLTDDGQALMSYYGTHDFQEAKDLMRDGWEDKSADIKDRIDHIADGHKISLHQRYSVVGHQASVPRYLMGIPTDMIRADRVPAKDKIIKVYKSIAYNYDISAYKVEGESAKALTVIKRMESSGIRCELYTVVTIAGLNPRYYKTGEYIDIVVRVKSSGERLNVSKVAYPLIHPSYIRRHMLAVVERDDMVDQSSFAYRHFGTMVDCPEAFDRSAIYLPAMIPDGVLEARSVQEIREILR